MSIELLKKTRQLHALQRNTVNGEFSFPEIAKALSDISDSNIYILNKEGEVLGVAYKVQKDTIVTKNELSVNGREVIEEKINKELLALSSTKIITGDEANFIFNAKKSANEKKQHMLLPLILENNRRMGTIIFSRYSPKFSNDDIILGEYSSIIVGLEVKRVILEHEKKIKNESLLLSNTLNILTHSEMVGLKGMFNKIENKENEKVIVASKIANETGITRSILVTALQKLETAGFIYSKSLGMKGTYIKILNSKIKKAILDFNVYG